MKALQVTTHLNIGGISNYILSLSRALKGNGIECLVVSGGGGLEAEFKRYDIETRRLNIKTKNEFSPKVFIAVFNLVKMVRDEDIDIIHAHTRVSQVAGILASRITGVPYVTTCHGFFKERLRKVFDTWGEKVIAISDAVKGHLEKDLGVAKERIETIYNGVDVDKFSRDYSQDEIRKTKESLGLSEGPVIGTVGRLSPVKGQSLLIEALAGIISKRRDVQGLIVGDGPEEAALKALVKSLGLEGSIHFAGSVLDTHKFLSVMDIFVFPSLKEGLGIALLEAMASGRACAASDIGGIRDLIKNGETGILFPVGDARILSDSISRLLGDESLRGRLGESASSFARKRFPLNIMADKVASLYKKVLRSHAAS